MPKTLKEQFIAGLTARGWTVNTDARSTKFVELTHPGADHKFYVGRSGALRRGNTVGSSIPAHPKVKSLLLGPPPGEDQRQ